MIGGVSLSSFLQMLEHERKSCTLVVQADDLTGSFYFEDGVLIDAEAVDKIGQEAAYFILSWRNPSFNVANAEDRMHRISLPLAHILLDSAKKQDEEQDESDGGSITGQISPAAAAQTDPVVKRVIQTICSIAGVKHYYLLDRQGSLITQSSRQQKLGDFITYCIVSGIQMKKIIKVKGPNRIHLVLENGETLLIVPGAGMIIGLLLNEFSSVREVSDQLRPALTNK